MTDVYNRWRHYSLHDVHYEDDGWALQWHAGQLNITYIMVLWVLDLAMVCSALSGLVDVDILRYMHI